MYAPVVPSKNHTRFQTKMGKVFSDQKGPKPLPFPYIRLDWTHNFKLFLYKKHTFLLENENFSVTETSFLLANLFFTVYAELYYQIDLIQRSCSHNFDLFKFINVILGLFWVRHAIYRYHVTWCGWQISLKLKIPTDPFVLGELIFTLPKSRQKNT